MISKSKPSKHRKCTTQVLHNPLGRLGYAQPTIQEQQIVMQHQHKTHQTMQEGIQYQPQQCQVYQYFGSTHKITQ